jgi:peptide deformylase
MSLPIVQYNDPILHRKGEKIMDFDAGVRAFAADMIAAMHAAEGIGLAAQQVGQAVQLCVVDLRHSEAQFAADLDGARPPLELFMPMVVANPLITPAKGTPDKVLEEGCLSFPGIRGDVSRPDEITVRFQDEYGRGHILVCDGLLARCIQHEADHLNGVLFIERMDKKTRAAINDRVKALAKETRAARKSPPL